MTEFWPVILGVYSLALTVVLGALVRSQAQTQKHVDAVAAKRDDRITAHSTRLDGLDARLIKIETRTEVAPTKDDLHSLRDEVREAVRDSAREIIERLDVGKIMARIDEQSRRVAELERDMQVSREIRKRGGA